MTIHQVRDVIGLMIKKHGSATALARHWNISQQYLSDVHHGRRHPGLKLLRAMRLRKETDYICTVNYPEWRQP